MRVVMSAGHGKLVRGAEGPPPWGLDEVDEARQVVTETAAQLREMGVETTTYWDDVSTSQNENLERIVDFHNARTRDLDISVHFNAYEVTSKPMGTEVLYVSSTGMEIADEVVDAMCEASGLPNRGPKKRTDLYFLNNTEEPAILIEVCFVDSSYDAQVYKEKFGLICAAIAMSISGEDVHPPVPEPAPEGALFMTSGRCSHFGGPDDTGVSPSEGLAFISDVMQTPHLFLPYQPTGTTGLARRLNPDVSYVACRWDYSKTPKDMLREGERALVRSKKSGYEILAYPADWGPHEDTGRVADLSPALAEALKLDTDDEVDVIYPAP